MPHESSFEFPKFLDWNPGLIYDPVPEWWIHTLADDLQAQLISVRLDTMQQVLRVQADGLAKAVEVIRGKQG